jgi:cell division FtsZ-interacting protein ZapD
MSVPLGLQIAEVNREIAMRKRVYPNWIACGRITQERADAALAALEAARDTLLEVAKARAEQIQPPLL